MTPRALAAALEAVTAELLAAATEADPARLAQLGARRARLVSALGCRGLPPAEAPELAAALRRILALDAQVLAALQAQRAALGGELEALGTGRRALRGYRAAVPASAVLDTAG